MRRRNSDKVVESIRMIVDALLSRPFAPSASLTGDRGAEAFIGWPMRRQSTTGYQHFLGHAYAETGIVPSLIEFRSGRGAGYSPEQRKLRRIADKIAERTGSGRGGIKNEVKVEI